MNRVLLTANRALLGTTALLRHYLFPSSAHVDISVKLASLLELSSHVQ
jgi:hypothetical protein